MMNDQKFRIYFIGLFLAVLFCSVGCESPTVTPNPVCSLSCIVRWQTPEPGTSWVMFGEGETLTHAIGNNNHTRYHEVIVVGMHADTSYRLQCVSVTEDDTQLWSSPLYYETGSLPGTYFEAEMDVYDESLAQNGWTLVI